MWTNQNSYTLLEGMLIIGWTCDQMYWFASAAVTNTTDWMAQTTQTYFLTVLDARNLTSGCRRGWFFWGLSPRHVAIFLFSHVICIVLISFYMDICHMRLGPTHITSFYLNYLFKVSAFKYTYICNTGDMRVGGTQFSL